MRLRRYRLRMLPALLSLTMLPACTTTQTTAAVVREIPCDAVPVITFSAPFMTGVDDSANVYDTPDTIAQVRRNNAAWRAVCGGQ